MRNLWLLTPMHQLVKWFKLKKFARWSLLLSFRQYVALKIPCSPWNGMYLADERTRPKYLSAHWPGRIIWPFKAAGVLVAMGNNDLKEIFDRIPNLKQASRLGHKSFWWSQSPILVCSSKPVVLLTWSGGRHLRVIHTDIPPKLGLLFLVTAKDTLTKYFPSLPPNTVIKILRWTSGVSPSPPSPNEASILGRIQYPSSYSGFVFTDRTTPSSASYRTFLDKSGSAFNDSVKSIWTFKSAFYPKAASSRS